MTTVDDTLLGNPYDLLNRLTEVLLSCGIDPRCCSRYTSDIQPEGLYPPDHALS